MQPLTATRARVAVQNASVKLTRENASRLRTIAELLNEHGRVSVAEVQAKLFPTVRPAAANKALERLLKAFNDGARVLGGTLLLKIDADKKLGRARQLWFEGEIGTPDPRLEAIASIPECGTVEDSRGVNLVETPNAIVLLTFNEHESMAVQKQFGDLRPLVRLSDEDTLLGELAGMSILHIHSHAGQAQVNAATLTTRVIDRYHPIAVIGVGIAMGLKKKWQKIGDVLVAPEVHDIEVERVNPDGSRTLRGRTIAMHSAWEKRFAALRLEEQRTDGGLTVGIGRFLCGNRLCDNQETRNAMKGSDEQAIGYDMESFGLAAAAHDRGTAWALVKGISDWGDGGKKKNGERRQILAATNAAKLARKAIERGAPDRGTSNLGAPDRSGPKAAPPLKAHVESKVIPRARLHESVAEQKYIDDVRGARASQHRNAPPASAIRGVLVMDELRGWIDDANGPPLFALLGEYGMGKTVTCERLHQELHAKWEADPTRRQPLLFNLKDLTLSGDRVPTLSATIEECMERGWIGYHAGELGLSYVLEKMAAGAVVIFDGLDEVLVRLTQANGQAFTNGLLRIIADYRARHPNGVSPRVLIACRTHYFRNLADQRNHFLQQDRGSTRAEHYRALELLPFTLAQVKSYLERTLPNENINNLMGVIHSVHNLEELSYRPYTLGLIRELMPEISADVRTGKVVNGVVLYRKMVGRWLERDAGKHHIRPDDKQDLAAHLAAHLWRARMLTMPVRDLEDWLHLWLTARPSLATRYRRLDAEQLDEDLRTATFLVRQDGTDADKGAFRFAHASLQEYFLAEYLLAAARDNAPERWNMPPPNLETLDFLGQMLNVERDGKALTTAQSWCAAPSLVVNQLLLAYALRANLKGWPGISLRGVDLGGGDFTGCSFEGLDLGRASFRGAKLANVRFDHVRLDGADFTGAKLGRAVLEQCVCVLTKFDTSDLSATTFHHCELTSATWREAIGLRTRFLHCSGAEPMAGGQNKILISSAFSLAHLQASAELHWLDGHSAPILACALSPDGSCVLSASEDKTLRIWDAKSGDTVLTLSGHERSVAACAFAPDGNRILSASADNTLRLWDAKSGDTVLILRGHEHSVAACAFSPDGNRILSASDDNTLRLWDAKSGDTVLILRGHERSVAACAFSPDGNRILSASDDNTLRLWDAKSGDTVLILRGHERSVAACAFSPDGNRILSASADNTLRLWDAKSGDTVLILRGHERSVAACAFSPDGNRILSASADNTLRLWDAKSGDTVLILRGHERSVTACAFSPDGNRILSASADRTLRIWDATSGDVFFAITPGRLHRDNLLFCAFSPDGKYLSAGNDNAARIYDAKFSDVTTLKGHEAKIIDCAFSPDGDRVLSASEDKTLRIWDAKSGDTVLTLRGHEESVRNCAFSPDGNRVLSASADNTLRLWDAKSGKTVHIFKGHKGWVRACAFSPDGNRILSASEDKTLRIWDAKSGKTVRIIKGHKYSVRDCAFSPDGNRILSASDDNTLRLWDAKSGKTVRILKGHKDWVRECAFSPDGNRVLSASADHTLRLWDVKSGKTVLTFKGHEDYVRACAFSPDGNRILSASDDNTLRLWDAKSGAMLRIHVDTDNGGWAIWQPDDTQLVGAGGDAWRYLWWRLRNVEGVDALLPLEAAGDVCRTAEASAMGSGQPLLDPC